MIKKLTLNMLQRALNQALMLDANLPLKLARLEDKVLELWITPLNVHFFIQFKAKKIVLLNDYNQKADTIIHSSPLGLIRLSLLPASKTRSLFNDKIRISGDVELGQEIKKIFDELDIDWEGHLALLTGDVIAHQIGSWVRKGKSFTHNIQRSIEENLSEYLQEELQVFPPREEVEDFFEDIHHLVLDVERLTAQINLILAQYEIP